MIMGSILNQNAPGENILQNAVAPDVAGAVEKLGRTLG
jgi:hypothetical protein